ncbi:TlyA family RNA methyltransferase [Minwuia sp.]|uniref:TlyA family RNA methyltransferase n=1 Tax=Minwuia sp. TaxID=2493630 RepID=UPI003A91A828
MNRERADVLLVQAGLAASRARARALILDGKVAGVTKPGQMMPADARLTLTEADHPWVSRGGLKLAHALDHFALPVEGRDALDVGASTGGFTDVLLARGARHAVAVDVGHGQLHPRLTADPRVTNIEGVNARDITAGLIGIAPSAIVADLSFISLAVGLPAALSCAAPSAWLVALIKPQFEVGRAHVGKGGIVRDAIIRDAVPETIGCWLSDEMGWRVQGVTDSPVQGSDGNREFLIAAWKA